MLVRPSLVLQVKLLPEDYSDDTAEEIKRCCIYQAQALVSELAEDECSDGNVMRLSIRLMRPYWDASDPKAQELWDGVMPQWLRNMTRNISNIMHNYNTVRHPGDADNIEYNWVDFEFGAHALLRIKVDGENRITPQAPELAQTARRLANEGAFGDGEVALIRIPSAVSYERQLQVALAAAAEGVDAETAEEAAGLVRVAELADVECTVESAVASGGAIDAETVEMTGEVVDNALSTGTSPCFDIDFSVWGIEYVDGRVVEFDTAGL